MASVLLCLLVAFAVSPPEVFYRAHSANRNRAPRKASLDDRDHDHSLEAIHSGFGIGTSVGGDGDYSVALLPSRMIMPGNGGPPGELLLAPLSNPVSAVVSLLRGRSPPAA